jgi:hypothetical protein
LGTVFGYQKRPGLLDFPACSTLKAEGHGKLEPRLLELPPGSEIILQELVSLDEVRVQELDLGVILLEFGFVVSEDPRI